MKRTLVSAIFLSGVFIAGFSQDKIITLKTDTKQPISGSFEKLRISVNGGLGYLVASSKEAEKAMTGTGFSSSQARSYYNNMKLGISANGDISYMITPDMGAGIKYNFFYTSASTEGFVDPGDGVHLFYTTYSENIYVNYAGALLSYTRPIGIGKSFKVNFLYSLGLTTYRNEAQYLNGFFLLTGKNFGADLSTGLEYFVTNRISIGADMSAFFSSLRKMKISDGTNTSTVTLEKGSYENLSRLDFSAGIKFYLW